MTKLFNTLILVISMMIPIQGFSQEAKNAYDGDKITHQENTSPKDFADQIFAKKPSSLTVPLKTLADALDSAQTVVFATLGQVYEQYDLVEGINNLERMYYNEELINGYKELATGKIKWKSEKVTNLPVFGYRKKFDGDPNVYFILVVKENCYNPVIGYMILETVETQVTESIPTTKIVETSGGGDVTQTVGSVTQSVTIEADTSKGNTYVTNNYYSPEPTAQAVIQDPSYGYGNNCLSAGVSFGGSVGMSFGMGGSAMWNNYPSCGAYYGSRNGGGNIGNCGGGSTSTSNYYDNSYTDNSWSFVDNSVHVSNSFNNEEIAFYQMPHYIPGGYPSVGNPVEPGNGTEEGGPVDSPNRVTGRLLAGIKSPASTQIEKQVRSSKSDMRNSTLSKKSQDDIVAYRGQKSSAQQTQTSSLPKSEKALSVSPVSTRGNSPVVSAPKGVRGNGNTVASSGVSGNSPRNSGNTVSSNGIGQGAPRGTSSQSPQTNPSLNPGNNTISNSSKRENPLMEMKKDVSSIVGRGGNENKVESPRSVKNNVVAPQGKPSNTPRNQQDTPRNTQSSPRSSEIADALQKRGVNRNTVPVSGTSTPTSSPTSLRSNNTLEQRGVRNVGPASNTPNPQPAIRLNEQTSSPRIVANRDVKPQSPAKVVRHDNVTPHNNNKARKSSESRPVNSNNSFSGPKPQNNNVTPSFSGGNNRTPSNNNGGGGGNRSSSPRSSGRSRN